MRSIIILTFIASCFLAVLSMPVPPEPKKRPATAANTGQPQSKKSKTLIDQPKKPKTLINLPNPPDPSIRTITLVDLQGQTTPDSIGTLKGTAIVRFSAATGFNLKGEMTIFKGSYKSVGERKWIYFILVGIYEECTKEHPCYGWLAYGIEYRLNEEGNSVVQGKNPRTYIGISKGKPPADPFIYFKGRPEHSNQEVRTKLQTEWRNILEEYLKEYNKARNHASQLQDMPVPHATIIFRDTHHFGRIHGDTPTNLKEEFTSRFSAATGFNMPQDKMTYEGSYRPDGPQKWTAFTLIGMFKQCTEIDPCYAWLVEGSDFTLSAESGHIEETHENARSYYGIIATEVFASGPPLPVLQGRPEETHNTHKEITTSMQREWDGLNKKFDKQVHPEALLMPAKSPSPLGHAESPSSQLGYMRSPSPIDFGGVLAQ